MTLKDFKIIKDVTRKIDDSLNLYRRITFESPYGKAVKTYIFTERVICYSLEFADGAKFNVRYSAQNGLHYAIEYVEGIYFGFSQIKDLDNLIKKYQTCRKFFDLSEDMIHEDDALLKIDKEWNNTILQEVGYDRISLL